MKKKLAFLMAVLLLVGLFSGCGGGSKDPMATAAPTQSGGTSEGSKPTEQPAGKPSEAPREESSPYRLAAGNFKTDENGFALEKYEYTVPFCDTGEVIDFWTICWSPQLLPEGGMNELDYCKEQEKLTGVHVEYVAVDAANRSENFAVLLASDDLCDLSASGMFFYPGTPLKAVLEEEHFINILDYKEYCPNYIYESKTKNPDDSATYKGVFYRDDLVYAFCALKTAVHVTLSNLIRGDWLDKVGIKLQDIVTWDDMYDVMCAFQSQIDTCTSPWGMVNTINLANCNTLNAFDTIATVSNASIPAVFQVDGKVRFANSHDNDLKLMQMLNKFWNQGLIHPNWQSATGNSEYVSEIGNSNIGYMVTNPSGVLEYNGYVGTDDVNWIAMQKILCTPGQTIHVGEQRSRLTYGSTVISTNCENIPLAVSWCDWRYSDPGSFFCSYGVEGFTWNYNDKGQIRLTDVILNNPDGVGMDWVMIVYTLDEMAEHGLEDFNRKYALDGGEELLAMYDVWESFAYDGAYEWPAGLKLSDEQTEEVNKYSNDISTYISENYISFLDGSKPFAEWDAYVKGLTEIGLDKVGEVYQARYDSYIATGV